MNSEEIIEIARNVGYPLAEYEGKPYVPPMLAILLKTAIETERERIKQANAPEIERVNAHIRELEDAVLAEREACAKLFDDRNTGTGFYDPHEPAEIIRERSQA